MQRADALAGVRGKRVADHGEVFTPAWMVEATLARLLGAHDCARDCARLTKKWVSAIARLSTSCVASIEQLSAIRAIRADFAKHGALQKAHFRPDPRTHDAEGKKGTQHEAATNPQGRARPAAGDRREMAADDQAARPRDAEIPLVHIRSAPNRVPARPPVYSPDCSKRAF